jgi:putative aldouronate transport system substrate-binding protein
MKKTLVFIGFVCMSALVFAGGGRAGSSSSEIKNPLNQAEGEYSLPIVKTPVTITYLRRDSETPAGSSFNTDRALVLEEYAKATGITVKLSAIPRADYQTLQAMRFSDHSALEDILTVRGEEDGSTFVQFYNEGVFIDMKPYIDRFAPNIKRFFAEHPEIEQKLTTPEGKILTIGGPGYNLGKTSSFHTFIRKDWLDKLGLPIPETPEEFRTVVKQMIESDPNGNGLKDEYGIVGRGYDTANQLGSAFGLSLMIGAGWGQDANGQAYCQLTTPAYRKFLEFVRDIINDGIMNRDFDSDWIDQSAYNTALISGRIGVLSRENTSYFVTHLDPDTSLLKQTTPEAVYVPIVWKDTGYGVVNPKEPDVMIWLGIGISTNCKDPVSAIRIIDYAMFGPGRVMNNYGIEGISYTVDNGVKVPIPNYWNTNLPRGTVLGNVFPTLSDDSDFEANYSLPFLKRDPALLAFVKNQVARSLSIVKEPWFSVFNSSLELSQEIASLRPDFETYRQEMYIKFMKGEIPLNDTEWNNYVNQMNALGARRIADIYNGK